jgi:phage terminase small subunit
VLRPKQQAFVDHYLLDLNATAAYKRAGYRATGRSAENAASRLLGNAGVRAAIQQAQAERARRCHLEADRVLKEAMAVAFSDLGDLIEFTTEGIRLKDGSQVPEAARKALAGIRVRRTIGDDHNPAAETVEFRLWDKLEALDKLMRHLGLLTNKLAVTGEVGSPLPVQFIEVVSPKAVVDDPAP